MTKKRRKTIAFALTTLVTLFSAYDMIESGHVRPGWVMAVAAGVGVLIFLYKRHREEIIEEKETR